METDKKSLITGVLSRIDPWQELAVFSVVLIQLSWLVPWYQWLIDPRFVVPLTRVIWVLGTTLIISYLIVRLLLVLKLEERIVQAVPLIILVLTGWWGLRVLQVPDQGNSFSRALSQRVGSFSDLRYLVPDEFVILVFIIFVWRSGVYLARHGSRQEGVLGQFRIGFVMFLLFAFVTGMKDELLPGGYLVLFFFASLMGLSTSRVGMISRFRGGSLIPFNSSWLGGMTVFISAIIGVGLSVGYFFGGQPGETIFNYFSGVIYGLALIAISPILLFLQYMGESVQRSQAVQVAAPTPTPPVGQGLPNGAFGDFQGISQQQGQLLFSNLQILQSIFLWAVILLIVVRIFRGLRKHPKSFYRASADELEIVERGSILDALKMFFQNPAQSLRDMVSGIRNRFPGSLIAAAKIRRIYAQFLNLCEDLGVPRPTAKTPLEFVPTAAAVLVGLEPDIQLITDAYLIIRYGELPEDMELVNKVDGAWVRIEQAGKAMLKGGRSSLVGGNV